MWIYIDALKNIPYIATTTGFANNLSTLMIEIKLVKWVTIAFVLAAWCDVSITL